MADNKVPVTITFRKSGTRPPVFVAGSYSDPQWQPQEMTWTSKGEDEYEYKAEVLADPGSVIQYKFRLGPGDWWTLDEHVESIADDLGNRNNMMKVPTEVRPNAEEAPTPESSEEPASPPKNTHEPAPEIRLADGDVKGDASESFGDSVTESGWLDPFAETHKTSAVEDWDADQDRVPLFAHECLGSTDKGSEGGGSRPHSPSESRHSLGFEHVPDKSELEDPELEQFPSRLKQISELIHEVEGELEEDETSFEGVPPSAVLGVPRRATNDFVGDFIGGSPVTSPSQPRPTKRLAVPRPSAGSVASDISSSVLSLQSIAEGGSDEDDEETPLSPQPVVLLPSPVTRPTLPAKAPTSEDDEAVVLESTKRKPAEPLAPVRPHGGEKNNATPSPKGLYRNPAGKLQKTQVDWVIRDGEYAVSQGKDLKGDVASVSPSSWGMEKGATGSNVRRSNGTGGVREVDWQTVLAIGGAALAAIGLALWWKGRTS